MQSQKQANERIYQPPEMDIFDEFCMRSHPRCYSFRELRSQRGGSDMFKSCSDQDISHDAKPDWIAVRDDGSMHLQHFNTPDWAASNFLQLPGIEDRKTHNVAIIGSTGSGRKSIVAHFLHVNQSTDDLDSDDEGPFPPVHVTLDAESYSLNLQVSQTIDSGSPASDVYLVVFAVTSRPSFLHACKSLRHIRHTFGYLKPAILVANKSDLVRGRQVSRNEITSIARELKAKEIETCMTLETGVDELLEGVIRMLRCRKSSTDSNESKTGIKRFVHSVSKGLRQLFTPHKSRSCTNLSSE